LAELRRSIEPLLVAERLPLTFVLVPGVRLRRAYGRCRWLNKSVEISVRCTADAEPSRWRRRGAIVATLLHELAHLRYRHHGPRFWALHRRLVDRAAALGVYDPTDFDAAERGRGDEKLAASAASRLAAAAREARRQRSRADHAALAEWPIGSRAKLLRPRTLAGTPVRVLAQRRTRLLVETARGRQYLVAPGLLERSA
jgi:WLM domain